MRSKLIILFTSLVVLAACQSNQKNVLEKNVVDSSAAQVASEIDKMVDEMAPPDSNYTGEFFLKYENGLMKAKGYFRFGKRHGQWFYYYPNGLLWSEALFNNGVMDGPSKAYQENGKLKQEGNYKMDKPVGDWNFYDTSGIKIFVRTYDSLGKVLADKPLTSETKK